MLFQTASAEAPTELFSPARRRSSQSCVPDNKFVPGIPACVSDMGISQHPRSQISEFHLLNRVEPDVVIKTVRQKPFNFSDRGWPIPVEDSVQIIAREPD